MKIGICDDNLEDINNLIISIKRYYDLKRPNSKYEIVSFSDSIDFLNNYKKHEFNLLFLDIFLNDTNGFKIAQQITQEEKIPIILYSSSKDFAIEGYQINIFGYLIKPLRENKLFTFLDRLTSTNNNKTLILKKQGKDEIYFTNNILFIESKGRQVIVHLNNNEKKVYYDSLDKIESRLHDSKFLRTHKSYLVNMDKISNLEERWFVVSNGEHVIIKIKDYKNIVQKYHDYIIKENKVDYLN